MSKRPIQISGKAGPVRLERDADVRPIQVVFFFQDFSKDTNGQILVRVLLHVEIDEGAVSACRR